MHAHARCITHEEAHSSVCIFARNWAPPSQPAAADTGCCETTVPLVHRRHVDVYQIPAGQRMPHDCSRCSVKVYNPVARFEMHRYFLRCLLEQCDVFRSG
eukprot:1920752-Pyramimonas_sp.AAC.1